jgi:hypothetical protein
MADQPALTKDVLTDPDLVNAVLLDRAEHNSVFRNAFQNQDVSTVNDDEFSFYVEDGVYDQEPIEIIEEGSNFPERQGEKRKVRVTRHKYGEKYEITMEGEMDDAAGETVIEANRKLRRTTLTMDRRAFDVLAAALAGNDHTAISPSGASGGITYEDIVDADTRVRDSDDGEYAPTQLYVGNQALGSIRKLDEFTHATDTGDEVIRNGRIGSIAGLADVYTSSSPLINMGSGDAYLVDPNYFGREAEWLPPTVNDYTNQERQVEVGIQMYGLIGHTETHANAAIRIGN